MTNLRNRFHINSHSHISQLNFWPCTISISSRKFSYYLSDCQKINDWTIIQMITEIQYTCTIKNSLSLDQCFQFQVHDCNCRLSCKKKWIFCWQLEEFYRLTGKYSVEHTQYYDSEIDFILSTSVSQSWRAFFATIVPQHTVS